jgi:bacterioferritin
VNHKTDTEQADNGLAHFSNATWSAAETSRTNRFSDDDGSLQVTREDLVALLNDDLEREYQAVISYVIYSQTLKGAQYMNIAAELERHAAEELSHALIIAGQVDYLGGMPASAPKLVKTSPQAADMLRFDLEAETETIHHYRQRVRQCEALGEYAVAEHIRGILVQEQDHQVALASALGVEVPNATRPQTPIDNHSAINAGITRKLV